MVCKIPLAINFPPVSKTHACPASWKFFKIVDLYKEHTQTFTFIYRNRSPNVEKHSNFFFFVVYMIIFRRHLVVIKAINSSILFLLLFSLGYLYSLYKMLKLQIYFP